jgi:AraC family transcriptional regulator
MTSTATGRLGQRTHEFCVAGATLNRAVYPAGFCTPAHRHHQANLFVVIEGRLEEKWGRRGARLTPGAVVVKPPAVAHIDKFVTQVIGLNIELAEDTWLRWTGIDPAFRRPVVSNDPALAGVGRRLAVELAAPDHATPLEVQGLLLSMMARVIRGHGRTQQSPAGRLDDVVDRLRSEYRWTLRLDDLASTASMHPTHLAKKFRERFGCSIGDYVRQLRIAEAQRALMATNRPIAKIAQDLGFSDQSHLGRAFRRETGETPASFRLRARGRPDVHRSSRLRSF